MERIAPMMPDMLYPTKTALVIRNDLAAWQKVNVAAFLSGGLAHQFPEMIGEIVADHQSALGRVQHVWHHR